MKRYLVTRRVTDNPDLFRALPEESLESISEVHYVDGGDPSHLGMQGTYGIDLDEETAGRVRGASNLVDLIPLDRHGLGEWTGHTPAEEIPDLAETDLMVSVPEWSRVPLENAINRPEGPAGPYAARSYRAGPVTDQGKEGACTGFCGLNFINGGPVMEKPPLPNEKGFEFYEWNRRNDEWPGDDYEGSSVSAMMKQLVALGHVSEGSVAVTRDFDAMARWKQGGFGSLMISTPWYEGMYRTDPNGFIRPTGRLVGGHAIWDRGITSWLSSIWFNSWGPGYGFGGNGYVSESDFRALIRQGLRAYVAKEIRA